MSFKEVKLNAQEVIGHAVNACLTCEHQHPRACTSCVIENAQHKHAREDVLEDCRPKKLINISSGEDAWVS